jgi:hypothetical protein
MGPGLRNTKDTTMKILFENWRRYLNEDLESKIRKALKDEGGAAGMEALRKHTGATEEEIKAAMGDWEGVGEHPDGDYILQGGDIKILSESNFFANMRAKRAKGEKPAKPGDEDYPTKKQWKKITAEVTRDTYGSEVVDRNKATFKKSLAEEEFYEVDAKDINEEYCPVCQEAQLEEKKKKRKKPCKKAKGKKFVKRVNGRCRSFGQAGKAKGGGPRIRPGTAKGDAYCARSAGIKKCKNPPCANTLSRRKWKCRGKKSMKS